MFPLLRCLPALILLASPALAAEKRAFQLQDLYRLKGVQLSLIHI